MAPRRCTTVPASGSPRRPRADAMPGGYYLRGAHRHWHGAGRQPGVHRKRGAHAAPAAAGGGGQPAADNPPDASLFIPGRTCTIYAAGTFDRKFSARKATLEARGATVVHLPGADGGRLPPVCHAARPGGARRERIAYRSRPPNNGALVRAGLVDELLLYLAPKLLAPGAAWPIWGRWKPWRRAGAAISGCGSLGPPSACACKGDGPRRILSHRNPATIHAMFTGIITGMGQIAAVHPLATRPRMASGWSSRPQRATSTMWAWATALRSMAPA